MHSNSPSERDGSECQNAGLLGWLAGEPNLSGSKFVHICATLEVGRELILAEPAALIRSAYFPACIRDVGAVAPADC